VAKRDDFVSSVLVENVSIATFETNGSFEGTEGAVHNISRREQSKFSHFPYQYLTLDPKNLHTRFSKSDFEP